MRISQPFSLSLCDLLVLFKELDHVVQGLVAVQYPEEIADPGDLSIKTGRVGLFLMV